MVEVDARPCQRTAVVAPRSDHPVPAIDFDRDGDLDLILRIRSSARLFSNDGRGRFVDASSRLPIVAVQGTSIAVLDLDGDGDADVVMPGPQGRTVLLRNDGSGGFTDDSAALPPNPADTRDIALGDVDGDRDLDMVLGNGSYFAPEANRLWLNDGAGRFSDATARIPPDVEGTHRVELGDVDGDLDLDLFAFNWVHPMRLYLNDGSGRFVDVTAARLPGGVTGQRQIRVEASALVDFDGDGDLDALLGETRRLYYWVNQGGGVFTEESAQLADRSGQPIAVGDVDGDGDLDAVSRNVTVQFNLRRQLAATGRARIGRPYRFEVWDEAPPGDHLVVPLLAFDRLATPLRVLPFGTLWIDPALTYVLPALALTAGRGTLDLPIPLSRALVGVWLHSQFLLLPASPADWHLTGIASDMILR